MPGLFIVNEHEPAMAFPQKNNDSCKFRFQTFYLGVGADADLQAIAFLGLPADRVFNGLNDGKFDDITIKFSP
jgi:hypothetical protein